MQNIKQILPQEDKLLQRIAAIDKPAKMLWYVGKLQPALPTVAVVGSRKPTAYGRAISARLVSVLVEAGVIIVSGLALGHDALAHQAALAAGGRTIAVIGNGLANPHPRTNIRLAEDIVKSGGLIISEYAPDTPVRGYQFLQRNRLISALADVVVVVEAGERSGTLNTAMHALEQGKELMAVPGNVTSPLSVGCNRLIAQGATPVLSSHDVLDKLGITLHDSNKVGTKIRYNSPVGQQVYDLILSGVTDGDQLCQRLNLTPQALAAELTMLELNAYIQPLGNNHWTVC